MRLALCCLFLVLNSELQQNVVTLLSHFYSFQYLHSYISVKSRLLVIAAQSCIYAFSEKVRFFILMILFWLFLPTSFDMFIFKELGHIINFVIRLKYIKSSLTKWTDEKEITIFYHSSFNNFISGPHLTLMTWMTKWNRNNLHQLHEKRLPFVCLEKMWHIV